MHISFLLKTRKNCFEDKKPLLLLGANTEVVSGEGIVPFSYFCLARCPTLVDVS